jgi:hypothetical protein
MARSPLSGGTAPDIPLLVIERIVALVSPTLASPPESWEKEERAEKELGTLLKLCRALPAWAGAVRDLGLVANVRVKDQDVYAGQRLSCTLADGSTRAKVLLSLVRSNYVSYAVPSGLDMTEMAQLRAIKFEGVDMRSVEHLPSVKHLEIHQCRNVNEKLSDWFGVCTPPLHVEQEEIGSQEYARNREMRVASKRGLPRFTCLNAAYLPIQSRRWHRTRHQH